MLPNLDFDVGIFAQQQAQLQHMRAQVAHDEHMQMHALAVQAAQGRQQQMAMMNIGQMGMPGVPLQMAVAGRARRVRR